jgi:hypothetical protein
MNKLSALVVLLLGIILLNGCNQQQTNQTQLNSPEPVVEEPTQSIEVNNTAVDLTETNQQIETDKSIAEELARYGEKTRRLTSLMDPIVFSGPEVGYGQLLNDDKNKSIDKWYFMRFLPEEANQNEIKKEKYSLIIDDNCFIHAVGFTNGSCIKYLEINKNNNITFDGYNGPSVTIYGKILANNSIQVSDIMLVQ